MNVIQIFMFLAVSTVCTAQQSSKTEMLTGPPGGRKVIKVKDIINENDKKWSNKWEMCPPGIKVIGFMLKMEPYQGSDKDDTSINGISLLCGGSGDIRITSEVGKYGEWSGMVKCLNNYFLSSFKLAFDGQIDGVYFGDNLGVDDIQFMCTGSFAYHNDNVLKSPVDEKTRRKVMNGVYRQYWSKWSEKCDKGICGINTHVDLDTKRFNQDRTGLNDVRMVCCP